MTLASLATFAETRQAQIWSLALEHAAMVVWAAGLALVAALAMAVAARRVPELRSALDGIANIFLTLPALALFSVFITIPFIGLGNRAAIVAMAMYSILPIFRNALAGFDSVSPATLEAAKGIGLSPRQRFWRVEFALALPAIIGGLRTSVLMNVGFASIAVLVGGGGLGVFIRDGLGRFPLPTSLERIWTGVLATILLGLAFDAVLALLARTRLARPIP